jgi:Spy/CpxP family protein refolding chaperone
MKKLVLVFLLVSIGCASDDEVGYPGGRRAPQAAPPQRMSAGGLLELMPPDDWWHDPQIQVAVNLTNDQMKSLDTIAAKQESDVTKMRQDAREVIRDLRSALEMEHPQESDIVAAGERVRRLRDETFDRELRLLAAEREVLTKDQWTALQSALTTRRDEYRNERGRGGYGGGRRGGRGRFPGM